MSEHWRSECFHIDHERGAKMLALVHEIKSPEDQLDTLAAVVRGATDTNSPFRINSGSRKCNCEQTLRVRMSREPQ